MNLITAIEILAGGVGSGCHGSNCGRPAGRPPDRTRYVQKKLSLPGGGHYTIVKPREKQVRKPRNPMGVKHVLKGQFPVLRKYLGAAEARPGQRLRSWVSEAHAQWNKKYGLRGATLFVHRYVDRKTGKPTATVVDEHNWITHRWRTAPPVRKEFKNQGRAAGYVMKRYGLSIPIKEYRG